MKFIFISEVFLFFFNKGSFVHSFSICFVAILSNSSVFYKDSLGESSAQNIVDAHQILMYFLFPFLFPLYSQFLHKAEQHICHYILLLNLSSYSQGFIKFLLLLFSFFGHYNFKPILYLFLKLLYPSFMYRRNFKIPSFRFQYYTRF